MRTQKRTRFLSALMALLMVFSLLPASALAADAETTTWEKIDFDKITADDVVAVTMTKDEDIFALPAAAANAAPKVNAEISVSAAENVLEIGAPAADFGWTLTPGEEEGTFTLQNASDDFLYVTAANAGVRGGTRQEGKAVARVFSWVEASADNGYLRASDGTALRYIGVYFNQDTGAPQDWRCYKGRIRRCAWHKHCRAEC